MPGTGCDNEMVESLLDDEVGWKEGGENIRRVGVYKTPIQIPYLGNYLINCIGVDIRISTLYVYLIKGCFLSNFSFQVY